MKILLLLHFFFNFSISANEVEIPDYSIFIQGQFKCDDSSWKNLPWDKRYRDLWQLAYKSVSIISDIETIEGPRKNVKKIQQRFRNFDSKYTAFARILCGEKAEVENNGIGTLIRENSIIREAFQKKGYLDLVSDDELYIKNYLNYSPTPFGGDDPALNKKGLEGFSCLVKVDDFIKDPFANINLKRLCEGENKKKIKFTQKEILRVANILKKARASTLLNKAKK